MDSIEHSLREIRWRSQELPAAEFKSHMERVAAYSGYLIALRDGKLVLAPDDDRGRILGAIFTNAADRDTFAEAIPKTDISQTVYVTATGAQLFENLNQMKLDGVVFNPGASDASRVIAFTPRFCELVMDYLPGEAADAEVDSEEAETDFDALAQAAFPNNQMGPREALNALWEPLLKLDDWIFAVRPDQPEAPYVRKMGQWVSVFAFTDSGRLDHFCRDNDLVGTSGVHFISMPPAKAIPWLQSMQEKGLEYVFFNFGGSGWYSPIRNLDPICRSLSFSY